MLYLREKEITVKKILLKLLTSQSGKNIPSQIRTSSPTSKNSSNPQTQKSVSN